jgi:hypothetical protein
MPQPGIDAVLHVYTVNIQLSADANPIVSGPFLNIKPTSFRVNYTARRKNVTGIRGPGKGRGETGALLTESARVSFEGEIATELWEGDRITFIPRRRRIYIEYSNGPEFFQGCIFTEVVNRDNPAMETVVISVEGDTDGNFNDTTGTGII